MEFDLFKVYFAFLQPRTSYSDGGTKVFLPFENFFLKMLLESKEKSVSLQAERSIST